jgi:hypothetical protein
MVLNFKDYRNWQASLLIVFVGFAVYLSGLMNLFEGDDTLQIVNNTLVHSLKNLNVFYKGSTFYNGQNFIGLYYRPLMTTAYSLLYVMFGARPFYFHLFQLLVCIGGTILLYLFLKYLMDPRLALFLAVVFLLHPLDSQVVYIIPNLQDALFFFFGMLALWLLCRFQSNKALPLVALALLLSLFFERDRHMFCICSISYALFI